MRRPVGGPTSAVALQGPGASLAGQQAEQERLEERLGVEGRLGVGGRLVNVVMVGSRVLRRSGLGRPKSGLGVRPWSSASQAFCRPRPQRSWPELRWSISSKRPVPRHLPPSIARAESKTVAFAYVEVRYLEGMWVDGVGTAGVIDRQGPMRVGTGWGTTNFSGRHSKVNDHSVLDSKIEGVGDFGIQKLTTSEILDSKIGGVGDFVIQKLTTICQNIGINRCFCPKGGGYLKPRWASHFLELKSWQPQRFGLKNWGRRRFWNSKVDDHTVFDSKIWGVWDFLIQKFTTICQKHGTGPMRWPPLSCFGPKGGGNRYVDCNELLKAPERNHKLRC